MSHGAIPTAASIRELLARLGEPPEGYCWHQRMFWTQVELYRAPLSASASAPEALPEGSTLAGLVVYPSRDALLADCGG